MSPSWVMTYNHEAFIREAVDSVLRQTGNLRLEVLISEDFSTDGTREVVRRYADDRPETVRLLLSDRNLRSNVVVRRGIEAARGAFVAFLDGDDFWTDPLKLKKQLHFMLNHPECSLCFHNARVEVSGQSADRNWTPAHHPPFSDLEDIWMGNFIPMSSTFFRRSVLRDLPEWYNGMFPITDWPLHIRAAESGRIGYLDEVMSVYRQHAGAIYSTKSEEQQLNHTLDFYRRMNVNLGYRYAPLIASAISNYFFEWAEKYAVRGETGRARECFRLFLSGKPLSRRTRPRRLIRLIPKLFFARAAG